MNTRHYFKEMAIIANELIAKGFYFANSEKVQMYKSRTLCSLFIFSNYCLITRLDVNATYTGYKIKYNTKKSINRILNLVDALLDTSSFTGYN